jgi:hypothetical protein
MIEDFELAFFETNAHHAAMVPKLTTDAAGNPSNP